MKPNSTPSLKVADFRRKTDHLERKVNDYHACCSADEVQSWKESTLRVLEEVQSLTCSRATSSDLDWHAKAITKVKALLDSADTRIANYKMKSAAKSASVKTTPAPLRLLEKRTQH